MLEGALIASILSMLGYVVMINIVSYKLYKLNLNYFEFLIGLFLLIAMYYFSKLILQIEFIFFNIVLFSFILKTILKILNYALSL